MATLRWTWNSPRISLIPGPCPCPAPHPAQPSPGSVMADLNSAMGALTFLPGISSGHRSPLTLASAPGTPFSTRFHCQTVTWPGPNHSQAASDPATVLVLSVAQWASLHSVSWVPYPWVPTSGLWPTASESFCLYLLVPWDLIIHLKPHH